MQIAIVGFLSALFLVWGVGGVMSGRQQQPLYAGKIFDRTISWTEYANAYELTRQNLRETYRVDLPKELVDEQTWGRLLLVAEAKRRQIRIPDADVVQWIQSFSLFQRNGAFDRSLYEAFLKFRRTASRAFEETVRDNLAISRLRAEVLREVAVSEPDIRAAYERTYQQARVAYFLADPADAAPQARQQLTPEAARDYFTTHATAFTEPDQVNLESIAFAQEDMAIPPVKNEDIQAYYTTHQQQLAPSDPGATEPPPAAPTTAVRERVLQILQRQRREDAFDKLAGQVDDRLHEGKTLEVIAQAFNRPVRTTGLFSQDQPIPGIGPAPDVTNQAFRLAVGERSGWIDTDNGGYVIRVKEKRPARALTFEEARAQAETGWVNAQARTLARTAAAEAAATCRTRLAAGESFAAIAQSLGHTVQQPEPFTRTGYIPGLGVAPAFGEAAFALAPGQSSDAVELEKGCAVIQLIELLPIDEARYAKDHATFAETLLHQQQSAHFQAWLEQLRAQARLVNYLDQSSAKP